MTTVDEARAALLDLFSDNPMIYEVEAVDALIAAVRAEYPAAGHPQSMSFWMARAADSEERLRALREAAVRFFAVHGDFNEPCNGKCGPVAALRAALAATPAKDSRDAAERRGPLAAAGAGIKRQAEGVREVR